MNKKYISLSQFIIEIISFLLTVASLIYAIVTAATYKGQIPTHFNFAGEVDGYGTTKTLLIMPLTMLGLLLVSSFSAHFGNPKHWNMPFKLNEKNALLVYHDMVWLFVLMELNFAIMTALYTFFFIKLGGKIGVVTAIMGVALLPIIIVFTVIASKHNKM